MSSRTLLLFTFPRRFLKVVFFLHIDRLFGIKCAKCNLGFSSSDLVMRARDNVYHIECFRCSVCSRQLLPGDEFSLREDELLCRADHSLLLERSSAGSPISPGHIHSNRPLHLTGPFIFLFLLDLFPF